MNVIYLPENVEMDRLLLENFWMIKIMKLRIRENSPCEFMSLKNRLNCIWIETLRSLYKCDNKYYCESEILCLASLWEKSYVHVHTDVQCMHLN